MYICYQVKFNKMFRFSDAPVTTRNKLIPVILCHITFCKKMKMFYFDTGVLISINIW